jgi:hypothetical protein
VGTILALLPDVIVLITDDGPTRNRLNTSSDGDNTFHDADLSRAITAAAYARGTGASLAGILVGNGATPTALNQLQSVVGQDVTSGPFSSLTAMLLAQVRSRCGSSLTLIPRLDTNGILGAASGTWSVTVNGSEHTIDAARTAGLTVNPSSAATITDISVPGFVFQRIDCSVATVPLASATSLPMSVAVSPDTTTSCQLVVRAP